MGMIKKVRNIWRGKERKGKRKKREEKRNRSLCAGVDLRATVRGNPTSKHQPKQPHTYTHKLCKYTYTFCMCSLFAFQTCLHLYLEAIQLNTHK